MVERLFALPHEPAQEKPELEQDGEERDPNTLQRRVSEATSEMSDVRCNSSGLEGPVGTRLQS